MALVAEKHQAPYDEIETILNFARVIANDCAISLEGNLLSDSQPYTFTMLNLAWRKLQSRLSNNSIEAFPQEAIIIGLPAQTGTGLVNPAIKSFLNYQSYNNGSFDFPNFYLPQDMEIPIRLWERVTGHNSDFIPMRPAIDGLPSTVKTGFFKQWEWRDDCIFFPGASQQLDLRIRYKKIMPDFNQDQGVEQPIPLIRCAVALAYLTVEIFAGGRGSTILPVFQTEKEDAIKQIVNSTTRVKQRKNFRRIPYSRRGR